MFDIEHSRRDFTKTAALGLLAATIPQRVWAGESRKTSPPLPFFKTRGIVLLLSDLLSVGDWPERAKKAGLTTIATHFITNPRFKHHKMDHLIDFLKSERGQRLREECAKLGIEVEHETHAMSDLLPRSLFKKDHSMFRMDEGGQRTRESNFCAHSSAAITTICENAVKYAQVLKPTTGRYFLWIDDGRPMCRCSKCRVFSDSDQALILENAVVKALRRHVSPNATLAHLAYTNTMQPPTQVKPEPGVFLEFAPIRRSWSHPLSQREVKRGPLTHGQQLDLLDANLEVFGKDNAQVLEYWLDASMFSGWKRPAKKVPWNREVFLDDLKTYGRRGIHHITSFGAFIDAEYIRLHGEPPIDEYGKGLNEYQRSEVVENIAQ
jgi:hypothetical protein